MDIQHSAAIEFKRCFKQMTLFKWNCNKIIRNVRRTQGTIAVKSLRRTAHYVIMCIMQE